jgi:integrase/recombinase XerC
MGQTYSENIDWRDALSDFALALKASREEKTERYYRAQLRLLSEWAEQRGVSLQQFRARHLREYLAFRADQKISERTRRHDAVCARVFFRYCKREEYIETNPLADYEIPKAAKAYVKMPSEDEVRQLLKALENRWRPSENKAARYFEPKARMFYHRRNYAIVSGLVETAARIGELLALRVDDFQPDRMQIAIREAKGDEPRIVPFSNAWKQAVEAWLRVRPKADSDLLFIDSYGGAIDVVAFGKQFRGYSSMQV